MSLRRVYDISNVTAAASQVHHPKKSGDCLALEANGNHMLQDQALSLSCQ
jgi:hypothetical protein